MGLSGSEERRRRGEGLTAFQRLESQARRLEGSILLLVALIAFAPPFFLAVIEMRNLRRHAFDHAGHVAMTVELYGRMPAARLEGLQRHLEGELQRDGLQAIQLFASDGSELVQLGEPVPSSPDTVDVPLGPGVAPFALARVKMPDERLRTDVARLALVHVMVGLVLAFGIYRIPVRAFSRAIRELESAQAQLVHSNRLSALGAMYAALAHEVNNPLGILTARVRMVLQSLREKGGHEEPVQDLEVVDRQATRIAEIMRSLLAFARRAEFNLAPLDLNAVVRDVVQLVDKPFAKQGVKVGADLAGGLPVVKGSPDHLQQVLLNLMTNARDAMPSGGRLDVRTLAHDGHVIAEVEDTGPGLAPDVLARLFEPFFTTKDVGKGTGLGLSVSYGIVSAHGGEIEASNAPSGGACFRVLLPAAGEADP
jgi:C4-dicarboxylate-specific signal transduction histidine kinase